MSERIFMACRSYLPHRIVGSYRKFGHVGNAYHAGYAVYIGYIGYTDEMYRKYQLNQAVPKYLI